MNIKLLIQISLTLFFFSTSSLLARAAFIEQSIDAYSFTFYRLLSGAIVLLLILYSKEKQINISLKKNWMSSFMLFLYAISFSYAYLNLDAGLGALILFAVVQLTIILIALIKKEHFNLQKSIGILLAFAGLTYLLFPTESFELSFYHAILMMLAGLAWGVYTLLGKGCTNAFLHTADNFTKSLVFVIIFYLFFITNTHISYYGIILAVISGGITSALGYLLWYQILPQLKILTSGVIQLLVPPIAIFLSILFLNEVLTFTLLLSTIMILSGIFLALIGRKT